MGLGELEKRKSMGTERGDMEWKKSVPTTMLRATLDWVWRRKLHEMNLGGAGAHERSLEGESIISHSIVVFHTKNLRVECFGQGCVAHKYARVLNTTILDSAGRCARGRGTRCYVAGTTLVRTKDVARGDEGRTHFSSGGQGETGQKATTCCTRNFSPSEQ